MTITLNKLLKLVICLDLLLLFYHFSCSSCNVFRLKQSFYLILGNFNWTMKMLVCLCKVILDLHLWQQFVLMNLGFSCLVLNLLDNNTTGTPVISVKNLLQLPALLLFNSLSFHQSNFFWSFLLLYWLLIYCYCLNFFFCCISCRCFNLF